MPLEHSLRNAFALLIGVTAVGVIGYMAINGVGFLDAFYMTAHSGRRC